MRLPLAASWMILALVSAPAAAAPDAGTVDFDEPAEQHSDFWERALEPEKEEYDHLIARTRELLRRRPSGWERSVMELLAKARRTAEHRPEAWALSARLHLRTRDWSACAAALERFLELGASKVGRPPKVDGLGPIDLELGRCLARSGELEKSIARYERLLDSRELGSSGSEVHLALGESAMALGRLDDAIAAFQRALAIKHGRGAGIDFALAVAYDRNEELSHSNLHLRRALKQDPTHRSLYAADRVFLPSEDEYYYLGLAELGSGERSAALFQFRRYLATADNTPWSPRARRHLGRLVGDPVGHDARVQGSAQQSLERVKKELKRSEVGFQTCVDSTPNLLLRMVITEQAAGRASRGRIGPRRGPKLGVRALVLNQFGYDSKAIRKSVSCAEDVARRLKLPKPSGPAGSYVTIEFTIIAH